MSVDALSPTIPHREFHFPLPFKTYEKRTRRNSRSYHDSQTSTWLRRPFWEFPYSTKDDEATDSEDEEEKDDYAWYYKHPERYIWRPRRQRQVRKDKMEGDTQRPLGAAPPAPLSPLTPIATSRLPHAFHALSSGTGPVDAPFFKIRDRNSHLHSSKRSERRVSTDTQNSSSSSMSSGESKMFPDADADAGSSTPDSVHSHSPTFSPTFSMFDDGDVGQLGLPSPSLNVKRYGTVSAGSDWVRVLPTSPSTLASFAAQ